MGLNCLLLETTMKREQSINEGMGFAQGTGCCSRNCGLVTGLRLAQGTGICLRDCNLFRAVAFVYGSGVCSGD